MDFFKNSHTCKHNKVPVNAEFGYCPECGQLVKNEWYILRCACCGIKEKAIIKNGEILPEENFCHNCGGHEYIIEKLPKINFIDINYAVLVRQEVQESVYAESTQCWSDKMYKSIPLLQTIKG